MAVAGAESISVVHQRTRLFGVNQTLNFVRKAISTATENDVQNVIKNCEPCQSIDPAPVRWVKGKLDVKENWERLAMEITHYVTEKFLSLIDRGPSKYVVAATTKLIRKCCHSSNTPSYLLRTKSTI